VSGVIPIEKYNRTELAEIIRRRTNLIVQRSLPMERLQVLASSQEMPAQGELAETMQSRYKLQLFVVNNWAKINSQLPCIGPTRGQCTIHLCSEGRHLDCFMSVPPHLLV
jgi:hypothetical protein